MRISLVELRVDAKHKRRLLDILFLDLVHVKRVVVAPHVRRVQLDIRNVQRTFAYLVQVLTDLTNHKRRLIVRVWTTAGYLHFRAVGVDVVLVIRRTDRYEPFGRIVTFERTVFRSQVQRYRRIIRLVKIVLGFVLCRVLQRHDKDMLVRITLILKLHIRNTAIIVAVRCIYHHRCHHQSNKKHNFFHKGFCFSLYIGLFIFAFFFLSYTPLFTNSPPAKVLLFFQLHKFFCKKYVIKHFFPPFWQHFHQNRQAINPHSYAILQFMQFCKILTSLLSHITHPIFCIKCIKCSSYLCIGFRKSAKTNVVNLPKTSKSSSSIFRGFYLVITWFFALEKSPNCSLIYCLMIRP